MKMQSAVLAVFVAVWGASHAFGQAVRAPVTDRMTDKVTPQVILSSDGARAGLLFRCEGVYLVGPALSTSPQETIVTWRADRSPAVEAPYTILPSAQGVPTIIIEQGRGGRFAQAIRTAQSSLAIRLGGATSKVDLEFPLSHDTRDAFAYAAEAAGASRAAARSGYDYLGAAITRAVANQDPPFASLMQRVGIALREGNRTKEAWELLPFLVQALYINRNKKVVEDMGQVIFGLSWQQLKPLMKLEGSAYSTMNARAAQQLDWLEERCGN